MDSVMTKSTRMSATGMAEIAVTIIGPIGIIIAVTAVAWIRQPPQDPHLRYCVCFTQTIAGQVVSLRTGPNLVVGFAHQNLILYFFAPEVSSARTAAMVLWSR